MKMQTRSATWVAAVLSVCVLATAVAEEDVLMQAMRDEMTRTLENLQMEDLETPYFVSYTIRENAQMGAQANFGALVSSNENRSRGLTVELRVGNPSFDNTNFQFGPSIQGAGLPLDDNIVEIRRQIWLATDGAYKRALESLAAKRAALQNETRSEELGDFSPSERFSYSEEPKSELPDLAELESRARNLSELFTGMPEIGESSVVASAGYRRTYYLNSEGTWFVRNDPAASVGVTAQSQSPDGTELHDFVASYGNTWGEIADEGELTDRVTEMGKTLAMRRSAPSMEDYIGPVLFEGQAATELFAQVMVPRMIGVRTPDMPGGFRGFGVNAGNPFADKIGARVLARSLSLVDDPTRRGGGFLGGRAVDDEGVPTQITSLVENGILKTLLTSRNPVRGIDGSTGSRRGMGPAPSNLVLTTRRGMSREELLDELMLLVEERQAEYGIVVRRVGNPGFRPRTASMMSFFGGIPGQTRVENAKLAYRVYPDGREELIQKAEFAGITDSLFKEVIAASDYSTVNTSGPGGAAGAAVITFAFAGMPFGGFGGGGGAVSVSVPDLLFEEVTMRKPQGNVPKPPVASHPSFGE